MSFTKHKHAFTQLISLIVLLLAPTFVTAGLFPNNSPVKMIDAKQFRQVMKLNQTSLVAFVAPWCGHCQQMVPELSKAALGLNPLIGTYAVDCDDNKNKKLCSQQDVKGFPTVKLFPRGRYLPPMLYGQERTAGAFYNYAARRVPKAYDTLKKVDDVKEWAEKNKGTSASALLLTKDSKVPLLWKVLANKFSGQPLQFAVHTDKEGKAFAELSGSTKEGVSGSKILVWIGGKGPMRYTGISKFEPLTTFFDEVFQSNGDTEGLPLKDIDAQPQRQREKSAQEPLSDGDEKMVPHREDL